MLLNRALDRIQMKCYQTKLWIEYKFNDMLSKPVDRIHALVMLSNQAENRIQM